MTLVEIKDFNELNEINDNKLVFDWPAKSKQEVYDKIIEMSRNDDYTTGNLLGYL